MNKVSPAVALGLVIAFLGGFFTQLLYRRWHPQSQHNIAGASRLVGQGVGFEPQSHRVTFESHVSPTPAPLQLPLVQAREIDRIRGLTGNQTRVRGRVFRVGHSAKSNTYFLSFGPSREALTVVIFASAVELFETRKISPKSYEGREVEVEGIVKDHPQYGLEIIIENPSQIKIVN